MRFVLVHGGWRDHRRRAPLVDRLEAVGHEAVAVDLPADVHGSGAQGYVDTVVAGVGSGTGPPVVLVGARPRSRRPSPPCAGRPGPSPARPRR